MTAQFSSLPGIADFNCERAAISRTASVPSSPEEETGLKIWKIIKKALHMVHKDI